MGGGVVEIRVEFSKMGGAPNAFVSLPWSAFRTATLPVQIVSEPDGGYRVASQRFRDAKGKGVPKAQGGEYGRLGCLGFVGLAVRSRYWNRLWKDCPISRR